MLYQDILEAIGHTPLVRLNRVVPEGHAEVYAKIESFNPMHSIKDRIALSMIEDAERKGYLTKDKYVVEPSSGNTGIGLAMVCAAKGYRLIITMPETFSVERRRLMQAMGAELVLTPGPAGMPGAIDKASAIVASDPQAFMPQQFENPANPQAHYERTAREILADLPSFDAFVSAVGTGGTITGVGRVLKEANCDTKIVAVEPSASPVLSGGRRGPMASRGSERASFPRSAGPTCSTAYCRSMTWRPFATAGSWPVRRASSAASPRARPCAERWRWPGTSEPGTEGRGHPCRYRRKIFVH